MRRYSKQNIAITVLSILLAISIGIIAVIAFVNRNNTALWNELYSLFGVAQQDTSGDDYIRFLDVGQGDCALLCSNGQAALIDTATSDFGDVICKKLNSAKITGIDLMMLSHNHDDHYGGAERITERFLVENLIIPDIINTDRNTADIKAVMSNVLAYEGDCFTAVQGMNSKIGDINLTVLAYFPDEAEENNRSIIAMAEIEGFKFLFTGDAEEDAEKRLLKESLNLDCDVLKAGHHGSKYSTTYELLDATTPEYAVISCGEGNQYSHPNDELLDRLDDRNIKTYRTDKQGDITFNIENGNMTVTTSD